MKIEYIDLIINHIILIEIFIYHLFNNILHITFFKNKN